jgi:adenylate kinase family enzyme
VRLLSAEQDLPARPRRIVVAGTAGAGKTTVAARIGDLFGIIHVEIDGLFHGPGWEPRPEFVSDVKAFADRPDWVTEWQYDAVRPYLAERADLVVWLDFPRSTVMRQVVGRTVSRRLRREELWNGNREFPFRAFFTDREHIVRWAWRTHGANHDRVVALGRARPDLPVVKLSTRRDVERWLAGPVARIRGSGS